MQDAEYGEQSTLFAEVDSVIVYEQPLNERIRNCLRLEHLFFSVQEGLSGEGIWNARTALVSMLEIGDLLSRSDTKGELIKELERQLGTLTALRNNPGVDQYVLENAVGEIEPILVRLKSADCQPGHRLRNDELINQIRQRIAIPGGSCNFDVPAFHHWLHRDLEVRHAMLNRWMEDLRIIETSTGLVLRILRESANPRRVTAEGGFYQLQLNVSMPCHLIRVIVDAKADVFPEISGGKHRFTVRFFRQPDTSNRPFQVQEPVTFELLCCGV